MGTRGLAIAAMTMRSRPAIVQWFTWFLVFSLGTTEGVGGDMMSAARWTVPMSALVALALFKPLGSLMDAMLDRAKSRQ